MFSVLGSWLRAHGVEFLHGFDRTEGYLPQKGELHG